jgi:hypothetical protein
MQVTPLEALDMLSALAAEERVTDELIARLRETVRVYGLDRPLPSDGRRSFGRRTYTCPFFRGGGTGCTLPRTAKPYGCLGFNARRPGVTAGGDCGTPEGIGRVDDAELNAQAAQALGMSWEKLPIPVALLAILAPA